MSDCHNKTETKRAKSSKDIGERCLHVKSLTRPLLVSGKLPHDGWGSGAWFPIQPSASAPGGRGIQWWNPQAKNPSRQHNQRPLAREGGSSGIPGSHIHTWNLERPPVFLSGNSRGTLGRAQVECRTTPCFPLGELSGNSRGTLGRAHVESRTTPCFPLGELSGNSRESPGILKRRKKEENCYTRGM